MLNVLKCSFIIIGTIIGAGFASGQEIASFFNRFGPNGFFGCVISSILFGSICFFTLYTMKKRSIKSYLELIKNNKVTSYIVEAFLFICFCIMIAGVGAFFKQRFNISSWIGAIIASLVCFTAFLYRLKGIEIINSILVPFILVGIVIIGIGQFNSTEIEKVVVETTKPFTNSWLLSSILYTSYNCIILVPVLTTFRKYELNGGQILLISILTFLILGTMGTLIFNVINIFYPSILIYQMPTLRIAEILGKGIKSYYSIVILMAIFTSAVSAGYAFLDIRKKHYMKKTIIMCVVSVALAKVGFADLINFFFPIFGYLGIIQIILISITAINGTCAERTPRRSDKRMACEGDLVHTKIGGTDEEK